MARLLDNQVFLEQVEAALAVGDSLRAAKLFVVKAAESMREELGAVEAMNIAATCAKAIEKPDQARSPRNDFSASLNSGEYPRALGDLGVAGYRFMYNSAHEFQASKTKPPPVRGELSLQRAVHW